MTVSEWVSALRAGGRTKLKAGGLFITLAAERGESQSPAQASPEMDPDYAWMISILFFGGTLIGFTLLRLGFASNLRYELSVAGLVVAGYSHLAWMAFQSRRNGWRAFGRYWLKLGIMIAAAEACDLAAIANGAWYFHCDTLNIPFAFLRNPDGLPIEVPLMELAGFNVAITGLIEYLMGLVGLKKEYGA